MVERALSAALWGQDILVQTESSVLHADCPVQRAALGTGLWSPPRAPHSQVTMHSSFALQVPQEQRETAAVYGDITNFMPLGYALGTLLSRPILTTIL